MSSESIKQILIRRDEMSPEDAEDLIQEARDELAFYIESGDLDSAENICQEYFGLEPDFLDELY